MVGASASYGPMCMSCATRSLVPQLAAELVEERRRFLVATASIAAAGQSSAVASSGTGSMQAPASSAAGCPGWRRTRARVIGPGRADPVQAFERPDRRLDAALLQREVEGVGDRVERPDGVAEALAPGASVPSIIRYRRSGMTAVRAGGDLAPGRVDPPSRSSGGVQRAATQPRSGCGVVPTRGRGAGPPLPSPVGPICADLRGAAGVRASAAVDSRRSARVSGLAAAPGSRASLHLEADAGPGPVHGW